MYCYFFGAGLHIQCNRAPRSIVYFHRVVVIFSRRQCLLAPVVVANNDRVVIGFVYLGRVESAPWRDTRVGPQGFSGLRIKRNKFRQIGKPVFSSLFIGFKEIALAV